MIQPRWLAWHLFAVAAVFGMLWLGDWQLHRALDGNALSWAYTFEWPVFSVFGIVFWIKTMLDEAKPKQADAAPAQAAEAGADAGLPAGARGPAEPPAPDPGEADPELDEYNAYLDRLNRQAKARGRR